MKWLLRGMAKRKEIISEIGPRPKYIIDAFNTLQSFKQKRKEMDTPTNTQPFQWTDTSVVDFHKFYMGSEKGTLWELLEKFKSSHSTVTEERREGWEILKFIDNNENLHAKHHYHPDTFATMISEKTLKIHSVKRLSDGVVFSIGDRVKYSPKARYGSFVIELIWINSINEHQCMVSNKDKSLVEEIDNNLEKTAAPIPEEPKPVLPIVPVYLTQTQIDKLIEMLGGSK